jgi:acyl-CoA thioester hydrolase
MNGWMETYRGMVHQWELDHNEHFTVEYYFTRFADAGHALVDAIGDAGTAGTAVGRAAPRRRATPAARAELAPRFVTADCYVRYLAELRAGDIMHVRSGVIRVGADDLVLGHTLFDSDGDRLCATVEQRVVQVAARPRTSPARRAAASPADRGAAASPVARSTGAAPTDRDAVPLTDAQRRAAEARLIDWDGAPRERRPRPAGHEGFRDSARDTVTPAEIDASGDAALSSYIHRFSAANGHAPAAFGMTPAYQRTERRGFSTFEFQLEILGPLRAGDLVLVRSALLHVGTSSMRIFHEMFDVRSGEARATLDQLGVHLDMDARRSTALPDALRDRARALVAPTVAP